MRIIVLVIPLLNSCCDCISLQDFCTS